MSNAGEVVRRPVSVLVVVHSDGGQVLLLKRIEPFEFWQSVTGSLQDGESHAEAAARELREETGIVAGDNLTYSGISRTFEIDPRWRDRFVPGTTENLEHRWWLRLPGSFDVDINPAEHSDYQWLPIVDAIDTVWSWTNKEALQQLRTNL